MANGLLCEEYAERVRNAKSKKQLFDICADANGVSFLAEMRQKEHPLAYETIWDGDNVILLDEDGDVQDAFTVLSSFPSSTLQLGNGYTVYTFEKVD